MHYTFERRERFARWVEDGCPGVTVIDDNEQERRVSADVMLGQMQRCTDVLPFALGETIGARLGVKSSLRGRSYGEAARRLLAAEAPATP
jgi:hypothetical protein